MDDDYFFVSISAKHRMDSPVPLENSLVAINTSDGSLCIWDAAGGTKLHTLITGTVSQEDWALREEGAIRFAAFEGGRLVVDHGPDSEEELYEAWDFTTGAQVDGVTRETLVQLQPKKLQHTKQLDGGLLVGGTRRDREAGFWIYRGSPQVSQR